MQVICKVVFESEEEKANFIKTKCPFDVKPHKYYGCMETTIRDCEVGDCDKCWSQAGIEMEVKNASREN